MTNPAEENTGLTAKEQAMVEREAVKKAEEKKEKDSAAAMAANSELYKTGKKKINVTSLEYDDDVDTMPLDDILALGRSPYQTREDLDGAGQKALDMGQRGLLTPLKVLIDGKSASRMITGHLRREGLNIMRTQVPARFAEFFPNEEIPVHVYRSLSPAEERAIATDHGQEKLLTRLELYSEVKQLVGTRDGITYALKNILDAVIGYSLKQETKRQEFIELEAKLATKEAHLSTLIAKYGAFRRGVMTPYFTAGLMPKFAEERFKRQFSGILEENEKPIGHGPAMKIAAAFKVSCSGGHFPDPASVGAAKSKVQFDFDGPKEGEKPFTKHNPNPQFAEVFYLLADGTDGRGGSTPDKDKDKTPSTMMLASEIDMLMSAGDSPLICELLAAIKVADCQKVRDIDMQVARLEREATN